METNTAPSQSSSAPKIPVLPEVRLPDMTKLVISSSPHAHSGRSSVAKIMWMVVGALLPAILASVWFFGPRALLVMAVTIASCLATEAIGCRLLKKPLSLRDGSAVVTGLLLALNLPVTIQLWVCVVGGVFAIGLGKMVYGGIGFNPFNPALVGRIVLLIALPFMMTTWTKPLTWRDRDHSGTGPLPSHWTWLSETSPDAVSTATPLAVQKPAAIAKHNENTPALETPLCCTDGSCKLPASCPPSWKNTLHASYWDLFLGNIPGSMGETSKLAILLGGIFLAVFGLIRWQVPVVYLGTVGLVTGIAYWLAPAAYPDPLTQLLSGGLCFAAFFMATDMVTTPLGRRGAAIFAFGCGLLTAIIRLWGSYPEGVTFSILIMNAMTPLIDHLTAGRPFGMNLKTTIATEVKK